MIKISDIFERHKKDKDKSSDTSKKVLPQDTSCIKPTDTKIDKSDKIEEEKISQRVADLVSNLTDLAFKIYVPDGLTLDLIGRLKNTIFEILEFKDFEDEFLKIFFADYPQLNQYLYYNVVNTCILALEVGKALKYDKNKLFNLGIGAFLHRIGLTKFLDIIFKNKELTKKERLAIKTHPLVGIKILENFKTEFEEVVFKIVEQCFERIDRRGYPFRISEPIEEAQIVNLAQKYESLTHRRTWRKNLSLLAAIKAIIEDKGLVDKKIKKALIERVGFYPPNTYVQLNTKQMAVVIKTNFKNPLRPILKIIQDTPDNKTQQEKIIDLAKYTHFYIEKVLE